MGKGKKSHPTKEALRQQFIEQEVTDLKAARNLAHDLFGNDAPTELVLACYERMGDAEDSEGLMVAREIARGGFETTTPTPEMVFGVHDRLFDDGDED